MTPNDVAARVTALLEALGPTPADVADTLLRADCYGVPNQCQTCPVAVYLLRSDLRPEWVVVFGDICSIKIPGSQHSTAHIPKPVDEFIYQFDKGGWPNLVSTGEAA